MNEVPTTPASLAGALQDSRRFLLHAVEGLRAEDWRVPRLPIVNPVAWELGHVGWFQERWILRHLGGRAALLSKGDLLYNSSEVHHHTRWDLELPGPRATLDTMDRILERVLERLESVEWTAEEKAFHLLALFHEDMHGEALIYLRQTLGYPGPRHRGTPQAPQGAEIEGDIAFPRGTLVAGASPEEVFAFDNEQWAHEVEVQPFALARRPVTEAEFLEFLEDGGYTRREFWSEPGWAWKQSERAQHPVYWSRRSDKTWQVRRYDEWSPIGPRLPVVNVNAFEAEAWCRWAGRRLPTETEWQYAASLSAPSSGPPRRYPWGAEAPGPDRAHLDLETPHPISVDALALGDSAHGCRGMLGNVWEWTASAFLPYPGFAPGAYADYSLPWFETHRVLRGGSFATRSRLLHNGLRNFFLPERRDVFAGFRSAALGDPG